MNMKNAWKKFAPRTSLLLSSLMLTSLLTPFAAFGAGTLYYNIDGNTDSYFEAENYTSLVGTFRSVSDASRSNGQYMDTPNGSGNSNTNYLTYELDVTNGGTFSIYMLSTGPDGSSDSFWVSVDGGTDNQLVTGSSGAWQWKKSGSTLSLPTGTHTLYVKVREDGAQADKILLSKSGSLSPSGFGGTSLTPLTRGSSDTQAPTAPTSLAASAASSSQINLSWNASSDNVGVTGYDVYRGGTFLKSVTGTSTSDTGLTASTSYSYTVRAKDAAGNVSANSNTASATTQAAPSDTQAPTAPTNLTASAVSSSQINLSWTASTDNVGVTGYDIYRGGTFLKTVTGTSTSDTGLTASTSYSYSVKAKDAAGNASANSNTASATTQASGGGLCTSCTPGANFDLTHWKLTLPDSSATEKSASQLEGGYTDQYFYTDSTDGAMTFWAPVTGGTTSGSSYPRSELREMIDPSDDNVNWTWQGTHTLTATQKVTEVPSTGKVIALQIHAFDGAPPLVKMQYVNGTIDFLVKQSAAGGTDTHYVFNGINLNDQYTAEIKVTNGVLSMKVNGVTQTHDFVAADPNWKNEVFYFKAGAYTQDNAGTSTEGGRVKIYSLNVTHQ